MRNYYFDIIYSRDKSFFALLLRGVLRVLSRFYGLLIAVKRRICFAKQVKLPIPVISIGNLTWGGTGKTPLVEYILQYCIMKGKTPVVLMRGYGADEDVLLRKNFPDVQVLSGKDRAKNARIFLEHGSADVFILDDGFQQWRLARDLDIVTVNGCDPWGPGFLIPRGSLRESLRELKRADFVVVTHADQNNTAALCNDLCAFIEKECICQSVHVPAILYSAADVKNKINPDVLRGKKVIAFCGIGFPESFKKVLMENGALSVELFSFADHYLYKEEDLKVLSGKISQIRDGLLLTTEKDFMRSGDLIKKYLPEAYVLKIRLEIGKGNERFIDRLDRVLGC